MHSSVSKIKKVFINAIILKKNDKVCAQMESNQPGGTITSCVTYPARQSIKLSRTYTLNVNISRYVRNQFPRFLSGSLQNSNSGLDAPKRVLIFFL